MRIIAMSSLVPGYKSMKEIAAEAGLTYGSLRVIAVSEPLPKAKLVIGSNKFLADADAAAWVAQRLKARQRRK